MAHYIEKDALVAEINKRITDAPIDCYGHQRVWAYNDVKDILNTLEVKDIEEPVSEPQVKKSAELQHVNDTCKENGNSLTQEPVSGLDNGNMPIERWKQAVEAASNQGNYRSSKGLTETRDDYFVDGVQWADEHPKEESVSEELEEAAKNVGQKYFPNEDNIWARPNYEAVKAECAFKDGANWQKEQFEKNRLAACDKQTEEEAEIECGFFMSIIEKEHRQPTFDDAIKYGMKLQKEKMTANTTDAMIDLPYENKDGGYTHLVDVSRPLPVGNNKIVIIFKED